MQLIAQCICLCPIFCCTCRFAVVDKFLDFWRDCNFFFWQWFQLQSQNVDQQRFDQHPQFVTLFNFTQMLKKHTKQAGVVQIVEQEFEHLFNNACAGNVSIFEFMRWGVGKGTTQLLVTFLRRFQIIE